MSDRGQTSDEIPHELLERRLDRPGRRLLGRELGLECRVATTTGDQPAAGKLLPVIEPPPCVVRAGVQELGQRLGRDDLATRRLHDVVEFA